MGRTFDDITKFIGGKSREETMIDEFFRLAKKAKDKWEMRKLEESLLKPKPIKKFSGSQQIQTDFKMRSIVMTFPTKKYVTRFSKFLRINQYKENNTWDVDIFVAFLKALESGLLKYNNKTKRLAYIDKNKRRHFI